MKTLQAALRNILELYIAPGAMFGRLPQQHRSALPLLILILAEFGISLAILSTGVIDYEIDWLTERSWKDQVQVDDRADPIETEQKRAEHIEKQKTFSKQLARVMLLGGRPLWLLIEIGLLTVPLFAAVALRGGKPDLPLLAEIGVFAQFVEIPRQLLCLWLIAQLQVTRIETSAAVLVNSKTVNLGMYILLRRLDPFVLWFWLLVLLGVWKTKQLRLRDGIILVTLLAVVSGAFQCILDSMELADWTAGM